MKSMLRRITAVFLILLLTCAAVEPGLALGRQGSVFCALGTAPSDMLAGGGRRVRAENSLYYISDSDGAVYERGHARTPLLEGPVAGLNYANGVLYYARPQEGSFDLCAFDLEAKEERVLLEDFVGSIGQLYLVDEEALVFSCDNVIWRFPLGAGLCRMVLMAQDLWSFVPTGCGIIYATGSLFDYTLYANGKLLARHVEDYDVRFDLENGLLVYTCGDSDYQMDLAAAFAGKAQVEQFVGLPIDPYAEEQAENPGWAVWDGEEMLLRSTGAIVCSNGETEDGPVRLFANRKLRQPAENGTLNIVRRARQMLNIQWTPVGDGFGGWGYTDTSYGLVIFYEPGVTYTGLPYGQGLSYVPWYTSYAGFINSVNDVNSKMYTERCTYWRGSQYYGTDCAAFVSWAWATTANGSTTPQRKTCQSLMGWDKTTKVGRTYTMIQLGDALISDAHAVLVTDVTYSLDGTITSIEISQANPTTAYNGCCYSTRYTGTAALQTLENSCFVYGGYSVYRNKIRDSVTYSHDCVVPVEGDECSICGYGVQPQEPDPDVRVGIDVSAWNGTIDWSTVAQHVDFAIIRVGFTGRTEGGIYQDSTAAANIRGCAANNIPFGLYYYAGATTPEKAMEEADAVLTWVGEIGVTPTLPIFYDVEESNNILTLSNSQLATVVSAFCSYLEDMGLRSGVYASASLWDDQLTGNSYKNWVHWVAHWDTQRLTARPGASVWQYHIGTVEGISGDVDMNYWIGSVGDYEHPSTAVLTAPSCTDGSLVSTCVLCGKVQEQNIQGTGHVPGTPFTKVEVEPTCTETGVNEIITPCTICGGMADRMVTTVEPLGHSWLLSSVLTQGETSHESTVRYACSRCKETKEGSFCAGEILTDMPKKSNWAHDAIDWVYFHGLFRGVSDHVFGLNTTMKRAMLVTVLYSLAGRPAVEGSVSFQDVRASSYYYKPVLWACQHGIASGLNADTFAPSNPVTREQVAVMLLGYVRYLGQEPEIHTELLDEYPDAANVSGYAVSAMAWAVENGILSGSRVGESVYLLPRESATRAQVAVMFMKFTKLLESLGAWSPECSLDWEDYPTEEDNLTPERVPDPEENSVQSN